MMLSISGIPPTLNEVRRMHHYEQARHKRHWEAVTIKEVKAQGLQAVSGPVVVTYQFHFTDRRRRDPDGYAYSAKAIQDGLVQAGILPDDNFDIVKELRLRRGEQRKRAGITVMIHPWEGTT